MPRPSLDMSVESVQKHLQSLNAQNEELRLIALRDYRELRKLAKGGDATQDAKMANVVNLENARNNSLKMAREAISAKKEIVRMAMDYVMFADKLQAKGKEPAEEEKVPVDERAYMRQLAAELRKQKGSEE